MTVDVLAVGPHPDDVEIGVGGTLALLASLGKSIAIIDLTRGEASTRGTIEERYQEAQDAAAVLGVAERRNIGMKDGRLANVVENQRQLIPHMRALRPRVILAPMKNDRHPDHEAAHFLIRDSNYLAGLRSIETGDEPWRAPSVFYYSVYGDPEMPPVVVDISKFFDRKIEALRKYASQLHNPNYAGQPTYVSSEAFWKSIEFRAAYWGSRVGAAYGEPLFADGPVRLAHVPGLEISA